MKHEKAGRPYRGKRMAGKEERKIKVCIQVIKSLRKQNQLRNRPKIRQKKGISMARKKENLEFRYYDIPHGEPLLALYGEDWIRPYGYDKNLKPIVDLHFHNLMEIGWCCYGAGEIILEGKSVPYRDGTLTVIPKNYPHTTNAAQANLNKWQYLFLDMDKTVQELYPDNHRLAQRLLYRINKTPCCTSKEEQPTLFILIRQIFKEMQEHGELYRESVSGLQKRSSLNWHGSIRS